MARDVQEENIYERNTKVTESYITCNKWSPLGLLSFFFFAFCFFYECTLSMIMRLLVSCMVKCSLNSSWLRKLCSEAFPANTARSARLCQRNQTTKHVAKGRVVFVKVAITGLKPMILNDNLLLSVFHCSFHAARVGYHWNGQHTILCCIDNTHQKVMGLYLALFPYVCCLNTYTVMKLGKCSWHCPIFSNRWSSGDGLYKISTIADA